MPGPRTPREGDGVAGRRAHWPGEPAPAGDAQRRPGLRYGSGTGSPRSLARMSATGMEPSARKAS
jgi:hypothetical protein